MPLLLLKFKLIITTRSSAIRPDLMEHFPTVIPVIQSAAFTIQVAEPDARLLPFASLYHSSYYFIYAAARKPPATNFLPDVFYLQ